MIKTRLELPRPQELRDRIEQLAWECRTDETPQEMVERSMSERFGYICSEYWCPSVKERTIDLDVCHYWIDKEKMLSRMDEVWEWADKQTRRMMDIMTHAMQEFHQYDVPPHIVEIPGSWYKWLGRPAMMFGVKCVPADQVMIISADHFGRFFRLNLFDLCEHAMKLIGGGRVSRCEKCGYRIVHDEPKA